MCVLMLFCLLRLSCNRGPIAIFVMSRPHDRSLHQWMLLSGCLSEKVALVNNRVMLVRVRYQLMPLLWPRAGPQTLPIAVSFYVISCHDCNHQLACSCCLSAHLPCMAVVVLWWWSGSCLVLPTACFGLAIRPAACLERPPGQGLLQTGLGSSGCSHQQVLA